jgi:hypothetical protein
MDCISPLLELSLLLRARLLGLGCRGPSAAGLGAVDFLLKFVISKEGLICRLRDCIDSPQCQGSSRMARESSSRPLSIPR